MPLKANAWKWTLEAVLESGITCFDYSFEKKSFKNWLKRRNSDCCTQVLTLLLLVNINNIKFKKY